MGSRVTRGSSINLRFRASFQGDPDRRLVGWYDGLARDPNQVCAESPNTMRTSSHTTITSTSDRDDGSDARSVDRSVSPNDDSVVTDLNVIHLYEPKMATGDEKALLRTYLALAQKQLLWKLEGLSDEELRRPMTKTSTNLIGIVKHLTGVTAHYLISSFGRDREFFPWELGDEPEFWYGGDMWATPEESPAELMAAYRRTSDAALESIDALDLDTVGTHHTGLKVSLRWMILNVLSDTLRHLGHADVLRESIDGAVGVDPVLSNTVDGDDDEYWSKFRQRVTGELTRDEWVSYVKSRPS